MLTAEAACVFHCQTSFVRILTKIYFESMTARPQHENICSGAENISFGAHTVTHPILTRMPFAEAVVEIVASKEIIESKLGRPVRLFAYPNGTRDDFNDQIKQVIREAGFACAVTTIDGSNSIDTDPFEFRRITNLDAMPPLFEIRLGWQKFTL